jgi:hypothetical protein
MLFKDLKNNPEIEKIVDLIINDENFLHKCEYNFQKIFEDGKIDNHDIPLIINLVLTIHNNYTKVKIKKQNLKQVLLLLITTLINKFKNDIMIDESLILNLLEPQIDLLLMSVSLKGKMSCCGSKPNRKLEEKEENLVNKIKLNKIEQKKETVFVIKPKKEQILPN